MVSEDRLAQARWDMFVDASWYINTTPFEEAVENLREIIPLSQRTLEVLEEVRREKRNSQGATE